MSTNLHECRANVNSQNGEDGIIGDIFAKIGTTTKTCCEFGAWDGIYLSNCRKLILDGWKALMIEGDASRCQALVENYKDNPNVIPVNCFVDASTNSLRSLLEKHGIGELDFLSVDIDGLDCEILETLNVLPRVICIEVNAGHDPLAVKRIDRKVAMRNIGQPLSFFVQTAKRMGYDLVCYNANAFFVRSQERENAGLPCLTCAEAYNEYLHSLDVPAKEWMYLVNLGMGTPFHRYKNPKLTRRSLGISRSRAVQLWFSAFASFSRLVFSKIKSVFFKNRG